MDGEPLGFAEKFAKDLRILEGIKSAPIIREPSTPKLLRVSPDDLVEGEWYWVDIVGARMPARAIVVRDYIDVFDGLLHDCEPRTRMQVHGMDGTVSPKSIDAIWGPISFELEGEA